MPEARIKKIIETLNPAVIITNNKCKEQAEKWGIKTVLYEQAQLEPVPKDYIPPCENVLDTDPLYVFFTSGSTGIPKGVIISHRAVIDWTEWASEAFQIDCNHRFGNQTPFYFDLSVLDIYQCLKNGSSMYIIPKELFSFPIRLLEYLQQKEINIVFWVPSVLCMTANFKAVNKRHVSSLKKVLFCGEVMPAKQLNVWRKEYPNSMFVNLYGPTEATVACTGQIMDRPFADNEELPIGKPCKNCEVIILDDNDCQAENGCIGELCIRGVCLSNGYYNNPSKTAEAFVQNPLNPNYPEIIYRTGDLVHYNEYGELMYDGRKDFQIKHLGHRIELGEIETVTSSIDEIQQNCCLYDDDKKQIALYYVGQIDENKLADNLKSYLPDYMVPAKMICLPNMPLNANGKIDRVALKEMLLN